MYLGIHRKDPARTPIVLRRALILGLVMSLLTAGIALADNVQNNVTVGGTDTFTVGGSTTVSYRIVANSGDGQAGCNASDGSPAVVTITTPAGVSATPNQLSFSACGTFLPTVFTASAAGNYSITVSVSDSGTGTYNTTPATFTLKVLAPSDTTPPEITPSVVGTLGNNGWYVSDVTVSWSVTDPESTVTSTTGCDPTTINTDTVGMTLTCSATSAGGTSSQSVTIKRDATVPTISGSAAPAPNGAGWNNSDVTVSFTCGDATSGIFSCSSGETLSIDGAGQSVTGTAVDNAGNSTSATVSGISIDKTAPTLAPIVLPNPVLLGGSATASPNASDSLSGVDSASCGIPDTTSVGSKSVSCTATDNAGNTASASATYSVIYNFAGFFRPVDNLPTLNSVKAGSAIPVKFSLNGNQGLGIFVTGFPKSQSLACDGTATVDTIEETVTAGGSSLSYDPVADQYNYVWKTDKSWANTCRQLQVKLIDGTTHYANFKFTK